LKPPRFEYADPDTVDDAVKLLAGAGDSAKVLAGGQSLMPMLNMRLARPDLLVDVNRIAELRYVRSENGELRVGALATHHDVATSAEAASAAPLLVQALRFVGHPAIRNRGTVCGSIAHADPAAEAPAVASALGATMVARGAAGERSIPADEFFRSWFTTALAADELLVELRIPVQRPENGSGFVEVARRFGDFAQVGVAATAIDDGDALHDVRLVGLAVGEAPARLRSAESALEGRPLDGESVAAAGDAAQDDVSPSSDIHSSMDYKRAVLRVLLQRAVRAAAADSRRRQGRR
jgi:carbon-monoxide dehydrogenase medium subunit